MKEVILQDSRSKILFFVFLFFIVWWIYLQIAFPKEHLIYQIFGSTYGIVALLGAIWGIQIAGSWGGLKSIMGRSILCFSFGLLLQEFGQIVYSIYTFFLHIPIPYPSIGDIGYFGSIPLYIIGVLYLAKASGARIGLQSYLNKVQAIIVPMILLCFSYWFFLRSYTFDWTKPLTIFLDFGYPLGQAIYVSLAFLTYLLSRKLLGGVMKNRVLLILFALVVQYISDYTFLYLTLEQKAYPGGIVDLFYLCSYFIMGFALLHLHIVLKKL